MKSTKKQTSGWFAIVATLILAGGALALATNLPRIISFRNRLIDHFISTAQAAEAKGDRRQMFTMLELAQRVSFGDPRPSTITAAKQIAMLRYDLAEQTISSAGTNASYGYLGELALRAQHYNKAEFYYSLAVREEKDASNLSGLARALISQGKTKGGCEKNDEAIKNNLADKEASAVAEICRQMLGGGELGRTLAYTQVGVQMYGPAEKLLLAEQNKIARDWLLLAQIAAARGDLDRAVERVDHALKLDDVDPVIAKFAIIIYQSRLDLLAHSDKILTELQNKISQLNLKLKHLPNY